MKNTKRGAALLTALALLCTLTLPTAAASDTVTIATVEEFEAFSRQCTRDVWSVGLTVELTADLDLDRIRADRRVQGEFADAGAHYGGRPRSRET